ncbi:MAG: hypothetical protein JSR70_11025 [Proteobacteria bacterium]|nr:hypothetical protein [Pseudomonadota bacterium]
MPSSQSLLTTRAGQFRDLYKELERYPAAFHSTPVIFCEGDSWFATPLAMNLLDWLVYPTPEDEAAGVPLFGAGGLFFRTERVGDLAIDMFSPSSVADLSSWYRDFAFDLVLLSGGGNDFVGDFLAQLFKGMGAMSVDAAFARVEASGRYDIVCASYHRLIESFRAIKPQTPILAHSYDYPQRMGQRAKFTLGNLGLTALFSHGTGPWIAPNIASALPRVQQQREFAKAMIDGFVDRVLVPLRDDPASGRVFDFVDLRGTLPDPEYWADEMHPTSVGFAMLARVFRREMRTKLSVKLGPTPDRNTLGG